ncbi:Cytochrome P450 4C1 [Trachymyrmex septentrionalis]|uniref:Cytochrome P450 4C1 n=1 Tax=Trachymyrmex septentrionalis TaxID=34720 RepID=A0A195FD40_9HYME|nr:Cytochrome P450 4C1 [Trachymyrmex septentrionalis]
MVTVPSWCTRPTNSGSPSSVSPPGIAFGGMLPPFTGTQVGLQPQRTCGSAMETFFKLGIIALCPSNRFFYTFFSNRASFSRLFPPSARAYAVLLELFIPKYGREHDLIAFEFDPTFDGWFAQMDDYVRHKNHEVVYKLRESTTDFQKSIWNQNRKRIAPGFSLNMLQRFFNTFVEESLMLTNKLEKVGINENEIIFLEHIATCALDIACKTCFRLKEILRYKMYSVWNESWFDKIIFNFTTLGREQQKTSKLMHSLINEIIQQQLHELNKLHKTETKTDPNKTFFNILMEAFHKKNFTQEMIRDNVITMITLTTDKITITINFVIFMLANFPEIQEKVYKELMTIYGTEMPISAPVKYDDLQQMHYLDQVIEETMRLFPTTPIIGRRLTDDVKIGNFILPKNTSIIIGLILMNRQEQYWPNPLKFDPDRFLPKRIKDCPSNYHIPFSDGPRNCIGIKYAMISIKVILATLIRTFVFKVDKSIQIRNIKLKTDITLSTVEPLKIRIKKRK